MAAALGGTKCRQNLRAGATTNGATAGFRAVPGSIVRRSAYIAQRRGFDAILREPWAPMSTRARWLTVGPRLALARRSARTCICRVALASAASLNPCKRGRQSSRTTALSVRAPRWSKAASSAKGPCLAWACSSANPPRSLIAKQAKSSTAKCRLIR